MKPPRPIVTTAFVVAAFDGQWPRFLAEGQRSPWVVVVEPHRARQFLDADLARAALNAYATPNRRLYSDPGDWQVYEMTVRASFTLV